jgi:hypothetical protein
MASIEIEIVRCRGRRSASYTVAEALCLPDREFV